MFCGSFRKKSVRAGDEYKLLKSEKSCEKVVNYGTKTVMCCGKNFERNVVRTSVNIRPPNIPHTYVVRALLDVVSFVLFHLTLDGFKSIYIYVGGRKKNVNND